MGWKDILKLGKKKETTKGIGALLPMPAYGRVNPELLFDRNGNHYGVDWTGALPQNVMQKIFEFVCPHTMDETYEAHEKSALESGCMLCGLRDLSHCVLVNKRWRKFAVPVLYRSIRIDSVHYCPLEDVLEERRMKKSKWDRNAEPEDTGRARMQLLCRTLRDDQLGLGACILILKTPFWIRESCKADIARIAAVAPNLRYADLPKGFYSADASSMTLRTELENRCPEIRKMTYQEGSEEDFKTLATRKLWINLEILELDNLEVDEQNLREVLAVLENLQSLKVDNMSVFGDNLMQPSQQSEFLDFPPVNSLSITNCLNLTAKGLAKYLSNPAMAHTLVSLELYKTGVQPADVHVILSAAKQLQHFSITEILQTGWPNDEVIPPLQSRTLSSLHYELTDEKNSDLGKKYYAYLATSILSNNLPCLRQLFVRDVTFPDRLIELIPPMASFMGDSAPRPFAGRGTGGNRMSVASNYGGGFGGPSSPPSRSGFGNLPSSPETKSGAFGRGSFDLSPPQKPFTANHARRESLFIRQQQQQQVQGQQYVPPTPMMGLKNPLEVFTKQGDEGEWCYSFVQPAAAQGRKASISGGGGRPISMIGISAAGLQGNRMSGVFGMGLGANAGGARGSIAVSNGLGGVAYVAEPEKPFQTSGGDKGVPEDEDALFLRQLAWSGIGGGTPAPAPKLGRANKKEKNSALF